MLGVSVSDYISYLLDTRVRSDVFSEIMNLSLVAVWLPRVVAEVCLHPTCSVTHWSRSLQDSPRSWGIWIYTSQGMGLPLLCWPI